MSFLFGFFLTLKLVMMRQKERELYNLFFGGSSPVSFSVSSLGIF